MDALLASNPITCAVGVLGDAVVCIGTQRGSLLVLEALPNSSPVVAGSKGSSTKQTSVTHPQRLRLVASYATHAHAIRVVAVCGVSWLVATVSDDATVVIQPLATLLCGGGGARHQQSQVDTNGVAAPSASVYPLRLRGVHTLPISHAAWVPGRSELVTSSYDGHIAVYCAARNAVINRIAVGFPVSTFALCSTDIGVVWAAGRGLAKVDLFEGSRIPVHGALAAQLMLSQRKSFLDSVNGPRPAGDEKKSTAGVERMQWVIDGDETKTRDDIHDEAWAKVTSYATQVVYNGADHSVTMIVPVSNGNAAEAVKVLRWKLRSARWRVAESVTSGSTSDDAAHASTESLETRRVRSWLAAEPSRVVVENIITPEQGKPQHGVRQHSSAAMPCSSWSLGFSSWHCPEVLAQPTHALGEARILDTARMPHWGSRDEITITDRKRQRKEAEETPASRELDSLRAAMHAAQKECDALAATLKDALQGGGGKR